MKNHFLILISIIIFSCNSKSQYDIEMESHGIKINNCEKIDTTFYKSSEVENLKFTLNNFEYVNLKFYLSGKIKSIHPVKNNQCHGKYIDWFENGNLKWTREYDIGKSINQNIEYYKSGKRKKLFEHRKNSEIECIEYYRNGKPKLTYTKARGRIYHYKNGKKLSEFIRITNDSIIQNNYHENGKLEFSGIYAKNFYDKKGQLYTGTITTYFENGQKSIEMTFINGKENGLYFAKYGNGNMKYEGNYQNGKLIGKMIYYNEDGSLTK